MKTYILYKITFPNNKNYIGLTTCPLHIRKDKHYSKMRNGSHLPVHSALQKFQGFETWEIVSVHDSLENLKLAEKAEIKKQNTQVPFGYNLTAGGDGTYGYRWSEENLKKVSSQRKGRIPWNKEVTGIIKYSNASKLKMSISRKAYLSKILRPFKVFIAVQVKPARRGQSAEYRLGDFIGEFVNITDFASKKGLSRQNIVAVLSGRRSVAGGFIFRYSEVIHG